MFLFKFVYEDGFDNLLSYIETWIVRNRRTLQYDDMTFLIFKVNLKTKRGRRSRVSITVNFLNS
jgi:hypothetical protein